MLIIIIIIIIIIILFSITPHRAFGISSQTINNYWRNSQPKFVVISMVISIRYIQT